MPFCVVTSITSITLLLPACACTQTQTQNGHQYDGWFDNREGQEQHKSLTNKQFHVVHTEIRIRHSEMRERMIYKYPHLKNRHFKICPVKYLYLLFYYSMRYSCQ